MAENENKKSGAKQAADAAKTAVNVAKGAGRMAAGDVIGGAKDIAKDGNVQKIIVGVVGFITAMIVMMTSVVPSVLFTPSEDAFSGEHSFLEVLKQPVDSIGDFLKSIFGNKDTDTEKSMIDSDSIQVLADNTTTDAENASESAKNTMNNMLKETKERFNKRHEELIKEIEADFATRPNGSVKTVNDAVTSGATTSDKEAVNLLCLYSTQNDSNVINVDFNDYLDWLGTADKGWFRRTTVDKGGPAEEQDKWKKSNWNVKPTYWDGTMLPQKEMDEINAEKKKYDFDKQEFKNTFEDKYGDKATSALQQLCSLEPDIKEEKIEVKDENGNVVSSYMNYTYTIKVKSSDEIKSDFVNFDETKDDENPINPNNYHSEVFDDMVKNTCEYFGIYGSGGLSGGGGSGTQLVQVALNEVGYLEKASNSQLEDKTANPGGGNYTKYGQWFGMNGDFWCNIFVSWCANECGLIDGGIIPKSALCSTTYSWFEQKGQAVNVTSASQFTEMQPGDIILKGGGSYGRHGAHIGIVEKVEDNYVYTVEGNTSSNMNDNGYGTNSGQGVWEKKYSIDSMIGLGWDGYCRPAYPASSAQGADGYLTGCQTYNLSDDTIKWVATCMTGEGGGNDLNSCRIYASHAANHIEEFTNKEKNESFVRQVVAPRGTTGYAWYAARSWKDGCTDEAIQAVKEVFNQGYRYLPRYVIEFDTFPMDVLNAKAKEAYQHGDIIQNPYGATYKFYGFFPSGDICGYNDAAYAKYKGDDELMKQNKEKGTTDNKTEENKGGN